MDVRAAVTFPFKDPRWPIKAGLFSLSVLGSLVLVGLPFFYGYLAAIMRRVRAGDSEGLPEWQINRQFFADAGRVMLSSFLWYLPLLVIVVPLVLVNVFQFAIIEAVDSPRSASPFAQLGRAILSWLIREGFASTRTAAEDMLVGFIFLGVVAQLVGSLVAMAYSWFLYAISPAIWVAALRGGVRDAVNFRTLTTNMRRGGTTYIVAIFVPLIAAYAAYVGCVFLLIGFFVMLGYGWAIAAYFYGLIWLRVDGVPAKT